MTAADARDASGWPVARIICAAGWAPTAAAAAWIRPEGNSFEPLVVVGGAGYGFGGAWSAREGGAGAYPACGTPGLMKMGGG